MSVSLPACPTLLLEQEAGVLRVTIDRPSSRNALTDEVVSDLDTLAQALAGQVDIRAVVLRGSGGTFCAGGDIKGFRAMISRDLAEGDAHDMFAASNLKFGRLLLRWNALPQVTIALVEGAAFGGGVGLVCAVDLALATRDARFALSETRLGVVPAQIAPFLVTRIGAGATRCAALTGRQFDAEKARAIGLINEVYDDEDALEAGCEALLNDILACAPRALTATKALLLRVGEEPIAALLQDAAGTFAKAARGAEGREGLAAFLEKRRPAWSIRAPAKG